MLKPFHPKEKNYDEKLTAIILSPRKEKGNSFFDYFLGILPKNAVL